MGVNIERAASVSAAEISRNFGEWQSRALIKPVVITHHGRARLILQSVQNLTSEANVDDAQDQTRELLRIRAELNAILAQMQEGFVAFDAEGRVSHMNRVAEIYFGVAEEDVMGRDLRDVLPQTRPSITWSHVARVQKSGGSSDFSVRSVIHPQSLLNVRVFAHGDGVGLIFVNVTGDEEARADQKWWEAVQAAAAVDPSSAIIRLNVRGGLMSVDHNFCAMTGFTAGQLETLLLTEIVHPHERLALARSINQCLTGGTCEPMNVRLLVRDGMDRRLRLSMSPMVDGPMPQGLVVRVLDLDYAQLGA